MEPNPMPPMPPSRKGPLQRAADQLASAVDWINDWLHRKLFGGSG